MTIGFLGNENNIPFAISRYLRERGHEIELLIFRGESAHFHPSADSYDEKWRGWVREVDFGGGFDLFDHPPAWFADQMADYELLLGTNYAPAYAERAGRNLTMFAPHGGDIASAVEWGAGILKRPRAYWGSVTYQRRGLGDTQVIHSDFHQPQYERNLARFAPDCDRWRLPFPTIYAPQYAALDNMPAQNEVQQRFRALSEANDLVAIAPCRQIWGQPGDSNPAAKGTNMIVEAWADFHARHPDLTKQLIFLEYGPDVAKTRALIAEKGVGAQVSWFPTLPRKDLMFGYHAADIVIGEFVHSWLTGGVLFESLVMNRPLITWRDDAAIPAEAADDLYPIYCAHSVVEIGVRLEKFLEDRNAGTNIGDGGRDWYLRRVVEPSLERYDALLS